MFIPFNYETLSTGTLALRNTLSPTSFALPNIDPDSPLSLTSACSPQLSLMPTHACATLAGGFGKNSMRMGGSSMRRGVVVDHYGRSDKKQGTEIRTKEQKGRTEIRTKEQKGRTEMRNGKDKRKGRTKRKKGKDQQKDDGKDDGDEGKSMTKTKRNCRNQNEVEHPNKSHQNTQTELQKNEESAEDRGSSQGVESMRRIAKQMITACLSNPMHIQEARVERAIVIEREFSCG
ncbi:hypothetical protein BJ508DRAFT_311750 [Ascobolus immersus RN42]|uniref:Uncharacterized protein n=1 Tax=Ascobolus immersus RN42 TaxID=1160509 RepID=A0A3N4HPA1_ASCIM|nr:hypothetical protein BJ508DRAFT_311750 [Ascobolus immersus RN42]